MAGLLEKVAAVSLAKPVVVVIDVGGGEKLISKKTADLVLTRALLTDALLDELSQTPNVELVAGSAVVSLTRRKADEEAETLAAKALAPLMVQLDSGRALLASHVIGADGKRSCVRNSARALSRTQSHGSVAFAWEEHEEVAWSVYIEVHTLPARFRRDAALVFRSSFATGTMIATATPVPGGRYATHVILYDAVLAEHPWLRPADTVPSMAAAQSGPADPGWRRNFSALLRLHIPEYAQAIGGANPDGETLRGAIINRRSSWIEITSGRYDALDGQVCGQALLCKSSWLPPTSLAAARL